MTDITHNLEKLSLLTYMVSSMLALGLALGPHDIIAPLRNHGLILPAVRLNFVLAPVLAWLFTLAFPLDPGHAAGLLLLGCAGGAPFLHQAVRCARSEQKLVVPLMGILTFGTIAFLPFALPLLIPDLRAEPWTIARPLLLLVVLPISLGIFLKSKASAYAARVAPIFGKIADASLLLFLLSFIALNIGPLCEVVGTGAVIIPMIYFILLFICGWALAGTRRPELRGVMALATTGRNFGAALIPAAGGFNDPKVTGMVVVSAVTCHIVSFAAASWIRRTALASPA